VSCHKQQAVYKTDINERTQPYITSTCTFNFYWNLP